MQEVVQNILKHAKATEISIEVYEEDKTFFAIRIQDNGVGFDMAGDDGKANGIGLTNMQNRASLIKARMKIESEVGKGTTVCLALPIPEEENIIID
jgi:signal transduction histidine kinase